MYNECRHILTNGNRCQSPALRHHDFCYFHSVHRAQPPVEATFDLNLPPLEDPDAIQLALSQLAQALAANKIDIRRARALAMVLRIASANFRHTIAGQRLLQKKSEPQQDPAPALYEQQMVRETCSHSDGTPIAPPKECPDPEEVPEPEHKWSLGRLLRRDAEEFRDTQRGARFFGFEPDPPQPETLPTLEATAEDNPPVLKNLQKRRSRSTDWLTACEAGADCHPLLSYPPFSHLTTEGRKNLSDARVSQSTLPGVESYDFEGARL